MADLQTLNYEIQQVRRNLSAMREVLSPRNTAVLTLEERLQKLLQEKNSAVEELAEETKDLPPQVQEMLKLRYVDGEKWAEIAKHLNYCESTLYKWLSRYRNTMPRMIRRQTAEQRKFFTRC